MGFELCWVVHILLYGWIFGVEVWVNFVQKTLKKIVWLHWVVHILFLLILLFLKSLPFWIWHFWCDVCTHEWWKIFWRIRRNGGSNLYLPFIFSFLFLCVLIFQSHFSFFFFPRKDVNFFFFLCRWETKTSHLHPFPLPPILCQPSQGCNIITNTWETILQIRFSSQTVRLYHLIPKYFYDEHSFENRY